MLKLFILITTVLVLSISGVFLYQNFQSKPAKKQETQTQEQVSLASSPTPIADNQASINSQDPCEVLTKGSADIPQLYTEGVTWQQPQFTNYEVPINEDESKKMSGCLIKSFNNDDSDSFKATSYYDDNLQRNFWTAMVTASGTFSSTDSYSKNNRHFVVRRYADSSKQQNPSPIITVELFYTP